MNILNWKMYDKAFGLEVSTAKAEIGVLKFDIRYDSVLTKVNPNCGLVLFINNGETKLDPVFGKTVDELIAYAEKFLIDKIQSIEQENTVLKQALLIAEKIIEGSMVHPHEYETLWRGVKNSHSK